MGKIVVLAGSTRKGGNTDLLVQAFSEGAEAENEIEVFSVSSLKINPCNGCNRCFVTEGNKCVQKDDMEPIYDALKTADTLVISSPVYFYGISARLKGIIDRFHTPLRNTFGVKRLALILVGAADIPKLFDSIIMQYNLVRDFFHLEDAGMVLVRNAKDKGDVKKGDALDKARALGKSLSAANQNLVGETC